MVFAAACVGVGLTFDVSWNHQALGVVVMPPAMASCEAWRVWTVWVRDNYLRVSPPAV